MVQHWVDTTTDEEARAVDRQMWSFATRREADGTVVSQAPGPPPENGEFWSHALDRIKDDPDARYAMARRHLPLPAASREMAIAPRTKIRGARKDKSDYENLLRELHHLAAMWSYAGYGPIQRVAYSRLAGLDLTCGRVGFKRLPLLGATDGKWMIELWGEPSGPTTTAELHKDMLAADLKRIANDEKKEEAERMDILFGKLSGNARVEDPSQSKQAAPKRRGITSWLLGR